MNEEVFLLSGRTTLFKEILKIKPIDEDKINLHALGNIGEIPLKQPIVVLLLKHFRF